MHTTNAHWVMQSAARSFIAMLVLVLVLVGCGEPATGPLERRGDLAGLDLRQLAERLGAATTKDTSWLDSFIFMEVPGFGRPNDSLSRLAVYLTDEEGHDVSPTAWTNTDTFTMDYDFAFEWPFAQGFFDRSIDSLLDLHLIINGVEESATIRYFTDPSIAGIDTVMQIFIDSTSSPVIPYSASEMADSAIFYLRVMDVDGGKSLFDSIWTQPDVGSINIPSRAFAFVLDGTPAYISMTRNHYQVQHTASQRAIGVLRRTHQGLYIERRKP